MRKDLNEKVKDLKKEILYLQKSIQDLINELKNETESKDFYKRMSNHNRDSILEIIQFALSKIK